MRTVANQAALRGGRTGWKPVPTLPLLMILLLPSPARAQKSPDAEVLLQAALAKEQVDGELEEAIRLYTNLRERYGSNGPVAARALVGIGQCYEKLGAPRARKIYERVRKEYADQREAVRLAGQGLMRLYWRVPIGINIVASVCERS
jgi:tetratricopeptide (TPR) repeat protein